MRHGGDSEIVTRKPRQGSNHSEAATRKPRLGNRDSEDATRKQRLGNSYSEIATRKLRLGNCDSEAASWKQLLGSRDSEAATRKPRLGNRDSEIATRNPSRLPSRPPGPAPRRSGRAAVAGCGARRDRLLIALRWDGSVRPESSIRLWPAAERLRMPRRGAGADSMRVSGRPAGSLDSPASIRVFDPRLRALSRPGGRYEPNRRSVPSQSTRALVRVRPYRLGHGPVRL